MHPIDSNKVEGVMMKKLMKNLLLFISAIGITYIGYAGIMLLLDKGSQALGRESAFGNTLEKLLFWLSHLGFGLILFPLLTLLVFFLLYKQFGRSP